MPLHEVWSEGYRASGDSAGAHLLGCVEAETFAEACDILCSPPEWQKLNGGYDPQRKTVWGCRLFNNYADASRSFG